MNNQNLGNKITPSAPSARSAPARIKPYRSPRLAYPGRRSLHAAHPHGMAEARWEREARQGDVSTGEGAHAESGL